MEQDLIVQQQIPSPSPTPEPINPPPPPLSAPGPFGETVGPLLGPGDTGFLGPPSITPPLPPPLLLPFDDESGVPFLGPPSPIFLDGGPDATPSIPIPTIPGIPEPINPPPPPPQPPPPPPPPDPLTGEAVHRFWDEQTQSHFFTASQTEFSDRENNPRYRYEGVEFNTPSPDITGALPVYRFENQQTGTFFYTLQSPDEITSQFPVLETDGIAFYAFSETTAPADAIPVYRFFNENASASTGTPVHFFTGTEENKDNVIANVPGFTFEGEGWYAFES